MKIKSNTSQAGNFYFKTTEYIGWNCSYHHQCITQKHLESHSQLHTKALSISNNHAGSQLTFWRSRWHDLLLIWSCMNINYSCMWIRRCVWVCIWRLAGHCRWVKQWVELSFTVSLWNCVKKQTKFLVASGYTFISEDFQMQTSVTTENDGRQCDNYIAKETRFCSQKGDDEPLSWYRENNSFLICKAHIDM